MMTETDLIKQSIVRAEKNKEAAIRRLNALKIINQIPDHAFTDILQQADNFNVWSSALEFWKGQLALASAEVQEGASNGQQR